MTEKIVLIGFMGSGKTTVGKALAKKLNGFELIDSDSEIEKNAGKSINDIFKDEGEKAFRDMESDYLNNLKISDCKIILSTGGGMPCHNDNDKLIKNIGLSVYLKTSPEAIYERVKDDTSRPLLKTKDKIGKISMLLSEREEFYENAADTIIITDGKTAEEIADEIIGLIDI